MYDVKVLVTKLEARGLTVAEDAAKGAVNDVLDWLEQSVKASATPFDDVALPVIAQFRKLALAEVDKIDGHVVA